MLLTPTEMERLTIFSAAELARRRRAKGLKLNYPEAVAIITDEILEGAREGQERRRPDVVRLDDPVDDEVMPGVAAMMHDHAGGMRVSRRHQACDGARADPAAAGAAADTLEPGAVLAADGRSSVNAGRRAHHLRWSIPATGRSRSVRTSISSR